MITQYQYTVRASASNECLFPVGQVVSVDETYAEPMPKRSRRIEERAGTELTELANDILFVARAIFAVDCRSRRRPVGEGWARTIEVTIPVRQMENWASKNTQGSLNAVLDVLTGDHWNVLFARETASAQCRELHLNLYSPDRICLFSDGLDSFAGLARQLVSSPADSIESVSSVFQSKSLNTIRRAARSLQRRFDGRLHNTYARMQLKNGAETGDATHQRTRSFLLICTAVAVALAFEVPSVEIYENGIEALDFPFSRVLQPGQASRAMDPIFLSRLSGFVSS
jgi:hypothetical protein